MKLINGMYQGEEQLAIDTGHGIYRVSSLARAFDSARSVGMSDVLREGSEATAEIATWVERARATGIEPDGAPDTWLAPVTRPGKILCVGLNYRPHVVESGLELPKSPVLFNKFPTSLVGQGAAVGAPKEAREFDYEAELVMVMGRRCAKVSEDTALDYVLGYCNGNDLSARDLQFRTPQWLLGKACDGFGPMGPYLVTADDVADPDHLDIEGRRNGVVVQSANTKDMIFSCRYLIAYISQFMTLEPGDVIFTGTPEGVIMGYPEDQREWLTPGDTFTVSIEGLGELVTEIGDPR